MPSLYYPPLRCRLSELDMVRVISAALMLRLDYGPLLVREHFSSPLLQFADEDNGQTFALVECPSESSGSEI